MEASANVETDLESATVTDKENDKILNAVRSDDDVEESKTDAEHTEESFEFINNGDMSDTDKSCGNNVANESVSTSKDIISLDSIVSSDTSDNKIVEHSVGNVEEIETGQLSNNNPTHLLSGNADDENLLDEIHSGDFNATSSPVSKSSGLLNTSVHSVDESFDVIENDALEEQDIEEHDIEEEEEEEKDQPTDEKNVDDTIVLVDDDDDEEEEEENDEDSEDCDDSSQSDNDDEESLDGTDKEDDNDGYDHKDDDISTLSSEADDVVEMITKEPDQKPKITPPKKVKTMYKKLVKRSIKM